MKTNWDKYSATAQIGASDTDVIIEMAVHLSAHATDRAHTRDGKPVGLTKDSIQSIIDQAEDKIIQLGKKFPTLIIKTRDAINIVGALTKDAGDWVFNVITVMVKKNFVPKNAWDKVVYVNEQRLKESHSEQSFYSNDDDSVWIFAESVYSGGISTVTVRYHEKNKTKVVRFESSEMKGQYQNPAALKYWSGDQSIQFSTKPEKDGWAFVNKFVDKNKLTAKRADESISLKSKQHETYATLSSIIHKIEKTRIQKLNRLQEMKIGTKVKYQTLMGTVVAVSPKQTSLIVEFTDKSRKRFFINKRAQNNTLDELSTMKELIPEEKKLGRVRVKIDGQVKEGDFVSWFPLGDGAYVDLDDSGMTLVNSKAIVSRK